jgi:uncharacterized repeat protein (TIGR03803 family)
MPNSSTEHRKLAAIMFTDMVGYSALSQRNESLALELLEEHRQLLRAVFPKHQGQEIKSTGDGFLVEFASALAAVQCAVEIQQLMRKRNEGRSAERRVLIRVGIHLGDVVRRENDVFGDGVNIAARIEPLAEPGGICVSRAVYEQIENKVEHALVQLSRPALKNIQATVEVYRLLLDETRAPRPAARRSRAPIAIACVAVALAAIGAIALLKSRSQSPAETAAHQAANTPTLGSGQSVSPIRAELQILHSFGPTNTEGVNGWGVVALSGDGYLYGCTVNRGPGGGGSIYRVRTNGTGHSVLHSFDRTSDGAEPTGGVIEGRDGVLYGTTFRGGKHDSGVVFRITKGGSDYRVLHHFASANDCRNPQSELFEAKDGWLYGTATGGGGNARGGVFKIRKDGTGYAIVTGFYSGQRDDPQQPVGGVIQLPDGALVGTTKVGGLKNNGTIYRIETSGQFVVLKSLGLVADGIMQPEGTLLLASDGLLYGTCALGGTTGAGAVFRLAPDGSAFAILHHFGTTVDSARQPSAGLIEAPDGSLLGTSFAGGAANVGAIFKLNKAGNGYQTLHSFKGGTGDGIRSRSRLTPGARGFFYSAALNGGSGNFGVVFQLAIPGLAQRSSAANSSKDR